MSDKDRFILRLNPTRRERWDRARGNLALSTWIKLLCDNAADAVLGADKREGDRGTVKNAPVAQ